MYQPLGSDPVEMLKNTDRQKKKNVFFINIFRFVIVRTVQDTDKTTSTRRKKETDFKKMQFVCTQVHWCRKMSIEQK